MTNETAIEAVKELGLSVRSEFVPFSKSRNRDNKRDFSLNWRVTLAKDGRDILTTDYSVGEGHCPAYKAPTRRLGERNSIMRRQAIQWECEHGSACSFIDGASPMHSPGAKAIEPDPLDVIYSLVTESAVIDYPTYEEWAHDFSYDPDSRKGEAIYRACLEIALRLRSGIGEPALAKLREAFQDY